MDPWDYLRDVFVKLAGGWRHSRIDELLPANWASLRAVATADGEPSARSA